MVRDDLGTLWSWLPEGGLNHDPYGYWKSERNTAKLAEAPPKPLVQL